MRFRTRRFLRALWAGLKERWAEWVEESLYAQLRDPNAVILAEPLTAALILGGLSAAGMVGGSYLSSRGAKKRQREQLASQAPFREQALAEGQRRTALYNMLMPRFQEGGRGFAPGEISKQYNLSRRLSATGRGTQRRGLALNFATRGSRGSGPEMQAMANMERDFSLQDTNLLEGLNLASMKAKRSDYQNILRTMAGLSGRAGSAPSSSSAGTSFEENLGGDASAMAGFLAAMSMDRFDSSAAPAAEFRSRTREYGSVGGQSTLGPNFRYGSAPLRVS